MTLTNAELRLIDWQKGRAGNFVESLFECICKADDMNLSRIGEGFPEEVKAFRKFRNEPGYWDRLVRQYNTNLSEGVPHGG